MSSFRSDTGRAASSLTVRTSTRPNAPLASTTTSVPAAGPPAVGPLPACAQSTLPVADALLGKWGTHRAAFCSFLNARTFCSDAASTTSATERWEPSSA